MRFYPDSGNILHMSITRPALVSGLAALFSFAACQSVKTQGVPLVDATPGVSPEVQTREVGQKPASTVIVAPRNPAGPGDASPPVAMMTPASAPAPKHAYSSVEVEGPYIAITFDDGPHAVHTPKLLDMLKERGIHATFYVLGSAVEANPEIARRIVAEGHEIANHSWNHPSLSKLSSAGVDSQIRRTNDVIARVTGVKPTTMRPPYGATNAKLNKRLDEEYGLKVILWSVDPLDWKYRNSSRVTQQILENTQAGGIVLAHDIHATTVAAMPATLDGLIAKGFKFVRVDELLRMERGAPSASAEAVKTPLTEIAPAVPAATPFVVTRTDENP